MTEQPREWIIQRAIDEWRNLWENWPGYSESLMTREEMMVALKACDERWTAYQFRGHNVKHATPEHTAPHAAGSYPKPRWE